VKLTGFVNSTPDFIDQPKVINGASDFLVAVLGDHGRHARSAVSAASLPLGVAVEIEAIFELK
jgi:enamine deaminase RidA (YjgF/YER057c/UK114 family)